MKSLQITLYLFFSTLALLAADSEKIENSTVLKDFKIANIEYVDKDSCAISENEDSLLIDSRGKKIKAYQDVVKFNRGFLKPDTAYILKIKTEVPEGDPTAFVHFLLRDTSQNHKSGTDIITKNTEISPVASLSKIKFKTPKNASDYAIVVSSYKGVKAKLSELEICEDHSEKFLPIKNDDSKFTLNELPKGAKEFEVDQPNNPNGEIVEAKTFGIIAQKNVSLRNVKKALRYCKSVGASKLVFEKNATYKFFDNGSINISDMKDFSFDGNGATFVFKHQGRNFKVENNLRVKIENLKIDWDWQSDPLASLAEIVNINKKENYIDFKFLHYDQHPAYPEYLRFAMLSPWNEKENAVGVEGERSFAFDMFKGKRPRPKFKWLSKNILRLYDNANQSSAKLGAKFRVQHYYYDVNNIQMSDNTHLTLSNIDILSCAGHALIMRGKQKYTLFDNVNIIAPTNDKTRIITSTADHLHIVNSRGFIKLVNCEFSRGADDCINFHNNTMYGTRLQKNSIQTRRSYGNIGDNIEFRNDDYSPMNFSTKLVDKKSLRNGRFELVFNTPIPDSKNGNYILFNRNYDTRNIIVRNCYFHHNRARGILILASDVTIENCRFKHNEMGAIKIETGYTTHNWCEGYGVNNVLIQNNQFDSCNPLGTTHWTYERDVFIGTYLKSDPSSEQTSYPILKNILFRNNTFKDTFGLTAAIGSAKNVIFAENKFVNSTSRKNPREYRNGFFVTSSTDVKIVGNTFEESALTPKLGVWYDSQTTSNIEIKSNKVLKK